MQLVEEVAKAMVDAKIAAKDGTHGGHKQPYQLEFFFE